MAHVKTEILVEKIIKELGDYGVKDYVFAIRDPDSPTDLLRFGGSVFWRMGLALEFIEDGKADRAMERQAATEEERDAD